MTALSVLAAAREAPERVALLDGTTAYSFADLAPRVRAAMARLGPGGAVPLLAERSADAIVTLYALLELGRPAILLHPRLTAGERAQQLVAGPLPAGSAAIVYTSGTSARPKGVILSRAALTAAAAASAQQLGWRDDDRWLLALPFAHVGGLSVLVRCLCARRTVVLAEQLGPDITLASLVPTQLRRALASPAPGRLRAVLVGGAAASPALLAAARAHGLPVLASYGLSETASQVATERHPGDGALTPLPGIRVRIQDGQIEVAGPTLFSGYVGGSPHHGWFATGDLGSLDPHGRLVVTGRASDLIITGGENVSPAEVEAAFDELGVSACVVGLPDDTWGQIVAAAVQGPLDRAALARGLSQRLAPFKRPRALAEVAELPRSPTGKLDRRAAGTLAYRLLDYKSF